jgi:vacuolar-type H+-ATPase subunit H
VRKEILVNNYNLLEKEMFKIVERIRRKYEKKLEEERKRILEKAKEEAEKEAERIIKEAQREAKWIINRWVAKALLEIREKRILEKWKKHGLA